MRCRSWTSKSNTIVLKFLPTPNTAHPPLPIQLILHIRFILVPCSGDGTYAAPPLTFNGRLLFTREMHCTHVVGRILVGAPVQQQAHHIQVTVLGCYEQGRGLGLRWRV